MIKMMNYGVDIVKAGLGVHLLRKYKYSVMKKIMLLLF
jgi:hypothetical protein